MASREVVVVTGASGGVGRATARYFGERGARVGLVARGTEGLEGARREIERAGGEALVLPTDVADHKAVEHAAEQVERKWGRLDVWVNNAMSSVFSPVREMKPEEYRRVTEVTYLGYVYGTLAALRWMLPRDKGTIVQVGSALAYRSIPLQSAYCAAKHAIVGFTDSLRCELHHDKSKVKITAVHMPALNTTQFQWSKSRMPRKAQPVPPIFQPELAACVIHHAAHHPRREYWLGWSTIMAITGQKFIPGLLDRYLGATGYDSQQYDGARDKERADNLWDPVNEDRGAHGPFDSQAHDSTSAWWYSRHRGLVAAAGLAAIAAVLSGVTRVSTGRIRRDIDEMIQGLRAA